jgi:ABC-type multidrug transport system ATPase subunit
MLHASGLSLEIDAPNGSAESSLFLLRDLHFEVPAGHLMAIVGPSGCGKSTLLKVIAGITEQTEGKLCWEGRDLKDEEDLHPGELGYVPQFSIAHDELTVEECVANSMALRTCLEDEEFESRLQRVLETTGLTSLADRRVKVLSGGQKRRLGLALELVTNPCLLLCDEVTSGLDPKSEGEITELLAHLARENPRRIVINVTHSLANLSAFDSVMVMSRGHLVYFGPPKMMAHYFSVDHPEEVYRRLSQRQPEEWAKSWEKNREHYHGLLREAAPKQELHPDYAPTQEPDLLPSLWSQVQTLLQRRWTIFRRDRGQVLLHLAMLFGFPLLVVIFALDGIKPLRQLDPRPDSNLIVEMQRQSQHLLEQLNTGGLVSGLIMLQVVLVTLMASNNAAREIASERLILEREKLGGLSPGAYLLSKILFLGVFVLAQSLWMGIFTDMITGGLPGNLFLKLGLLILVSAAMTAVCLGISAWCRSPEKATILSIYLVGFQLPLSGAILTLPTWLQGPINPCIAAFWAWSGSLRSMGDTAFYDAVKKVTQSPLVTPQLAAFVLLAHLLIGLGLAYSGSRNSQWE